VGGAILARADNALYEASLSFSFAGIADAPDFFALQLVCMLDNDCLEQMFKDPSRLKRQCAATTISAWAARFS
jgi:hypothetical protein